MHHHKLSRLRILAVISTTLILPAWQAPYIAAACEGGGGENLSDIPLLANPSPLRFGLVTVKTTAKKSITFTADETIKIEATIPPPNTPFGEGATNTCNNTLLKTTQTCTYEVTFYTTAKLGRNGLLTFHYEVEKNNKVETENVELEGTGQ